MGKLHRHPWKFFKLHGEPQLFKFFKFFKLHNLDCYVVQRAHLDASLKWCHPVQQPFHQHPKRPPVNVVSMAVTRDHLWHEVLMGADTRPRRHRLCPEFGYHLPLLRTRPRRSNSCPFLPLLVLWKWKKSCYFSIYYNIPLIGADYNELGKIK